MKAQSAYLTALLAGSCSAASLLTGRDVASNGTSPHVFVSDVQVDSQSTTCMEISTIIGTVYYTLAGPWTNGNAVSGSFSQGTEHYLCVETTAPAPKGAGGAMYIGPNANPGPGSTKLECFFPMSGTANCDVSLVDGYSLSLTCGIQNPDSSDENDFWGGDVDLWTDGIACPDQQGPNCLNTKSYASSPNDVAPFFKRATGHDDGNYCVYNLCAAGSDVFFPVQQGIICLITGTKK